MSSHTQGPWRVNTCRLGDKLMGWHIAADEHGSSLPVCLSDKYSEYRDAEEEIRNAFLIAAAPDMLEALRIVRGKQGVYFWCGPIRVIHVSP